MSGYISSYFIEPALRQARRFSSPRPEGPASAELQSHAQDQGSDQDTPHPIDDSRANHASISTDSNRRQRCSEPGQISLGDLRETYGHETDTYHAEEVAPTIERDANVARETGLQGLLPLNDVRSNYVFGQDAVDSPAILTDNVEAASEFRLLRADDIRTLESLSSMSLDTGPSMTSNPSHAASQDFMSIGGSSSSMSSRSRPTVNSTEERRRHSSVRSNNAGSLPMSSNLPEDDGMKALRLQIHQIRDMALSNEEKALRMHNLMTSDYKNFRAQLDQHEDIPEGSHAQSQSPVQESRSPNLEASRQRAGSHVSTTSCSGRKGSLVVSVPDLIPSYQPRQSNPEPQNSTEAAAIDDDEEDQPFGCAHYRRNVKVQCPDCQNWYTCRHCHDEAEKHPLIRNQIRNMLCMVCGTPQRAAKYCKHCSRLAADYYCDLCKLWDDDAEHRIYHCPDCGICRRGEGLGKDYIHCKRCNVCINIAYAATHRCVERATECDCPICGEWMFTSSTMVVAVQCGHYMHRPCHDALMQTSFKCPICNRSAINMGLQWLKLDHAIEAQPMPSQFQDTKVWITCNDCSTRTLTSFHWLGNKCTECGSYNTNQVKMINSPSDQELQSLQESQSREIQALREAERQMGTENGNAAINLTQPPDIDLNDTHDAPVARQSPPQPPDWGSNQAHQNHIPHRPYHADPVSPAATIIQADEQADSNPYFRTTSRGQRASATDELEDLDLTDPSPSGTEDERESVADDVAFWGEPVSPTLQGWSMPSPSGWSMPSMPRMPSVSRPDWPRMPSVSMPSMPNMPSIPNMPSVSMPGMPRAISPTTIWAAGSPTFNGWNLPSPSFFPLRRGGNDDDPDVKERERDEADEDDEGSDSSDDGTMDWEGEADEDVDEMDLFGHR